MHYGNKLIVNRFLSLTNVSLSGPCTRFYNITRWDSRPKDNPALVGRPSKVPMSKLRQLKQLFDKNYRVSFPRLWNSVFQWPLTENNHQDVKSNVTRKKVLLKLKEKQMGAIKTNRCHLFKKEKKSRINIGWWFYALSLHFFDNGSYWYGSYGDSIW